MHVKLRGSTHQKLSLRIHSKRVVGGITVTLTERSLKPSSVDPPVTAFGGGAEASADDSADGGIGFSLEKGSAWDAFSGRPECVNAISAFLEQLDDEPRLRSAAMLRTLGRVREQLERTSEQAPLDTQVCIRLQDALVLMTQLMSRLR